MRTVDFPSFLTPETPVWDVCFFSAPHLIQTSVMLPSLPADPSQNFAYYTKLAVFLRNRQSLNFKSVLGKPLH